MEMMKNKVYEESALKEVETIKETASDEEEGFPWIERPTFFTLMALCGGAFGIQPFIVQLVKNNAKPSNNTRDMVVGHLFTGVCYVAAGVLGYYGFRKEDRPIAENITAEFAIEDFQSFLVRLLLCFQILCVYPLQLFVLKIWALILINKEENSYM